VTVHWGCSPSTSGRPDGRSEDVAVGVVMTLSASRCLAWTGNRGDLVRAGLAVGTEQELTLIRNLPHHVGHSPGFGVQVGSRVSTGMLGVWGFAMLSSATTREVVDIAARDGCA